MVAIDFFEREEKESLADFEKRIGKSLMYMQGKPCCVTFGKFNGKDCFAIVNNSLLSVKRVQKAAMELKKKDSQI